jgi:hypothetical protein
LVEQVFTRGPEEVYCKPAIRARSIVAMRESELGYKKKCQGLASATFDLLADRPWAMR